MRDKKLKEIHQQQIDYVMNSGITVSVVEIYGTVDIQDKDGNTIKYMQDWEGSDFISERRHSFNKWEDITMAELNYLMAYPYADLEATA